MKQRVRPVSGVAAGGPAHLELGRRGFLGWVGLAALGIGVSACSPPSASSGSQSAGGRVLAYGEAGAFSTFNPWAQQLNQLSTANQVFGRLVFKDVDGKPTGDLATSWKVAEDGTSITLKLRADVQWHDGAPVVADDFVTMFAYLSDPALRADVGVQKVKELFAPVGGVTAPDPATVVMSFTDPTPYALDLLNFWYAVRFDDPSDAAFIKHLPVGTGPFKMTGFDAGRRATFGKFDGYYDKSLPKVDRFTFDIFAEGSNVVSNLASGQVNGILVRNYADAKSLKSNPAYFVEQVRLGVWLVMVNASKAPFDKVEVRQALSYSMNRHAFAEAVDFGLELPVTSPFFTAAATAYVPELVGAQAFDLDKAKSLLEAAGINGLSIDYPAPSSFPNLGAYGEIWQRDLAKIGVTLNLHTVSQARWYDLGAGKDKTVDVVPWQVGRCLQDSAVFFAASSQYRGADQRFGYRNDDLERLLDDGRIENDPAKRKQIYQRINQIVVDQCVNISLVTYSETFAWSKKVAGPAYDLAGNLRVANASVAT